MGRFDDGERHAVKVLDKEGFFAWQLQGLDPDLEFAGWLESQTAALSGQQLRGDCVACFTSRNAKGPPWACLLEAQGQGNPNMVQRMTIALCILNMNLRHGKAKRDRFFMMGAILNLSKHKLQSSLDWTPTLVCPPPPAPLLSPVDEQPGVPVALPYPMQRRKKKRMRVGVRVRFFIRNVRWESAWSTLADIAAGRTALCILIWVPLMRGGDDPEVMALWCKLALRASPSWVRADIIELARLFAEMAKRLRVWLPVLKRFDMKESKVAKRWIDEGRAEGLEEGREEAAQAMRTSVVKVLHMRFPGEQLPEEMMPSLKRVKNLDSLLRWHEAALTTGSVEQFWQDLRNATIRALVPRS